MAGVSFLGSEQSAFNAPTATDVTAGGTFRTPQSRGAMGFGSSSQYAYCDWDAALAEGWIHYMAQGTKDNDAGDTVMLVQTSAFVNLFRLSTQVANEIMAQAWNGSAWVNIGTSFASTTSLVEMVVRLKAGASGLFEIYEGGALKDSGSYAFAGTDMKRVYFTSPDESVAVYASEVILGDNAVSLVTSQVETKPPTADATDTAGAGTYADVDEVPYSDSDGIVLSAAGDQRSFTSPARTTTLLTVLGVSVAARMKCGASGPQNAKFYLKIGGVRYYSGTFALSIAYAGCQYTWALNPATGIAWTPADASAATLEWGIEAVA